MYPSFLVRVLLFCNCLFLIACNTTTPEKYFDITVLNSNMLVGFANEGLQRELESPSAKMGKNKDEILQMKRREVIDAKIRFAEEALVKLKGLNAPEDGKEILQTSIALYEYVLPVYKTDYVQLAKLYDENAPKKEIETKAQAIHDRYSSRFEELYSKLILLGKPYASKHDINVNGQSSKQIN